MQNRSLFVPYLMVFVDVVGYGLIIPFLPYIVTQYGASAFFATAMISVYALMQIVFAPIVGAASDKWGRRTMVLFSLSVSLFCYLLYVSAFILFVYPTIILTVLFVSRLLAGVGGSTIGVVYAYISDHFSGHEKTKIMVRVSALTNVSLVVGPLMGGLLGYFPAYVVGLIAATLCLFAVTMAYFYFFENKTQKMLHREAETIKKHKKHSFWQQWSGLSKNVKSLLCFSFIEYFCFAQMFSIVALFVAQRYHFYQMQVGFLIVGVAFIIAFTRGVLMSKLMARYNWRYLLMGGSALFAVGFFGNAMVDKLWPAMLFTVLFALGAAIIGAIISVMLTHQGDENQGFIQGADQSVSAMAFVLGPISAGLLYDYIFITAPFIVSGILSLILFCLTIVLKEIPQGDRGLT